MPSDELYLKLAEALSQPSKAYKAAKAGLEIPEQALQGYLSGSDIVDRINQRRRNRQTLSEVLGGTVEGLSPELQNLPFGDIERVGPGLGALARFSDAGKPDANLLAKQKFMQEQQARNQAAIADRQKKQQDFIRSMVGAKGNQQAVNAAKNAAQGLGYVDQLWTEMGKLNDVQKMGAANPLTEKLFPTINTLKQNIRRTAGFSEGGKNLTENELNVVVQSFEPTTADFLDPNVAQLKKQIARDFYLGTIDLFEAAKLLGPAGDKLIPIANAARQRAAQEENQRRNAMVGGMIGSDSGGGDLDALFDAVNQ